MCTLFANIPAKKSRLLLITIKKTTGKTFICRLVRARTKSVIKRNIIVQSVTKKIQKLDQYFCWTKKTPNKLNECPTMAGWDKSKWRLEFATRQLPRKTLPDSHYLQNKDVLCHEAVKRISSWLWWQSELYNKPNTYRRNYSSYL